MKGPTFSQTTDNATIAALVNTLFDDGDSICVGYQNRLCEVSPLGLIATLKGSDVPTGWPCFNTNDPVVFSINPSTPSNKGGLPITNVWAGRTFMFESDTLSYADQEMYWIKRFKDMPFTLIFTGNKSIHALITLDADDEALDDLLKPIEGCHYSKYMLLHRLTCLVLAYHTAGNLRLDTATCTPNRTTKAPNFTREIYRPGCLETITIAPKAIRVGKRVKFEDYFKWLQSLCPSMIRFNLLLEEAEADLNRYGSNGKWGVSK
jgi:hypothetical protein